MVLGSEDVTFGRLCSATASKHFLTYLCLHHARTQPQTAKQTILADLAEQSNKLMADSWRSCNDASSDVKPSPLPFPSQPICFVPEFFRALSVICHLHAFSRPTHQTIASRILGASTSAICPFSVPRSLSRLLSRLLQCSDTCRFLAGALGMRQKCFVLVMAITALLFLGCLQIEFTRVPMHVLRPHIQLSQHLLRTVFVLYKQPMVSSLSYERKTRKCSCEETRTAARGRCVVDPAHGPRLLSQSWQR